MKFKISRSMNKCIEEMKSRAIVLVQDIPRSQCLKISQNVTKHKNFEFHIINLNKLIMKLYINGKFYKSYIYSGTWSESS